MEGTKMPLNAAHLKIIATISMVIDHICGCLFTGDATAFLIRNSIGRVSCPIFIFLVVEGFFHTRNRLKYALRILIVAVITEPLYDMAARGTYLYPGNQNICFALFCGLVMMILMTKAAAYTKDKGPTFTFAVQALIAVGFAFVQHYLKIDYSYSAVILFAIFYFIYWQKNYIKVPIGCVGFAIAQPKASLLAAIPLLLYNGERGNISKAAKYFFYAIYPLQFVGILIVKAFLL